MADQSVPGQLQSPGARVEAGAEGNGEEEGAGVGAMRRRAPNGNAVPAPAAGPDEDDSSSDLNDHEPGERIDFSRGATQDTGAGVGAPSVGTPGVTAQQPSADTQGIMAGRSLFAVARDTMRGPPPTDPAQGELQIIGQIVGAEHFQSGALFAEWCVRAGHPEADRMWPRPYGIEEGVTHTESGAHEALWCHPFDVKWVNPPTIDGWPRMLFRVYERDMFGRNHLQGYAVQPVPLEPGIYKLRCGVWRPSLSYWEQVKEYFVGGSPVLSDEQLIDYGMRRGGDEAIDRLEVSSTGFIVIEMSVLLRNRHRPNAGFQCTAVKAERR